MQAGNAGLSSSRKRAGYDVASRRTCCAHGARHRHVPAFLQHAVLQVNCAPTAASAAAAASVHHLLEHSSQPVVAQEPLLQHGSNSGATRPTNAGNEQQSSADWPCQAQQDAQQPQLHQTATAHSAARPHVVGVRNKIAYTTPISSYTMASNGRSPASISHSPGSKDVLVAQTVSCTTAHSPTVEQQAGHNLDEVQEHLLLHHVQQDTRQIEGIVRSMVQEVMLQEQQDYNAAGQPGVVPGRTASRGYLMPGGAHLGSSQQHTDQQCQCPQQDCAAAQQHQLDAPQQVPHGMHVNGVMLQQQQLQQHDSSNMQQPQLGSLSTLTRLPEQRQHSQQYIGEPEQQLQHGLQETFSKQYRHQRQQHQDQHQHQQQSDQQQQQQLHWQHQARLQQQQATAWLSSQIAAAASWQEVRHLLQVNESSSSFIPRHVVQLLLRLEQLVLHQQQQQQQQHGVPVLAHPVLRHEQAEYGALVHILLRRAATELNSLRASEVACLLAAAARLPLVKVPKPWTVRVMTRAHHIMSDFSPTSLAVATWALSKLDLRLRADFEQKLLQAFKEKAGSAPPRALSLMAHGLVVLRVRPDGMWLGVFVDRVQRSIAGFSSWDLSMCLWGLVRLRCPAPRSLLTAALNLLIKRMPECTHNEAVVSVWALGRLGHSFHNSNHGDAAAAGATASTTTSSSRSSTRYSSSKGRDRNSSSSRNSRKATLQQQQQHNQRRPSHQQQLLLLLKQRMQQGSMPAQCITTMLYGLALLHCTPAKEWQAGALAAVHQGLGQLDGQGLSNLLYAVGLLKWQPSKQWQLSFWNALVTQVQKVQPHTRQQQQRRRHRAGGVSFGAGSDTTSSWQSRVSGPGVVQIQQQQQQPGLSSQSWEQLHEAQRMLGWKLPLQQLQHLQEQQQLHRISQAQLGNWAAQVQQHMRQHQQRQREYRLQSGFEGQQLQHQQGTVQVDGARPVNVVLTKLHT